MNVLPRPLRRLAYAARGLTRLCLAVLDGPRYDLGDLRPNSDEVLAQLTERNG